MSKKDPWLKVYEVANMLNLHVNTIKRLCRDGKIKFHRVCDRGDIRIPLSEVNAYLERHK